MGSLKLTTASSGSVILSPANTASDVTITVPAVTGTMITTASAGTVLQVVNATYSTTTSNGTATYADTGLTATITPKFASSKILVSIHQNGLTRDTTTSTAMTLILLRNSTQISFVYDSSLYSNSAYGVGQTISTSYLDSPSTTSSTTYKTQFKVSNGFGGTVTCQHSNSTSTITLMEIAA